MTPEEWEALRSNLNEPLRLAAEAWDRMNAPMRLAAERIDELNTPLREVAARIAELNAPMRLAAERIDELNTPLREVAARIDELNAPMRLASEQWERMNAPHRAATEASSRLSELAAAAAPGLSEALKTLQNWPNSRLSDLAPVTVAYDDLVTKLSTVSVAAEWLTPLLEEATTVAAPMEMLDASAEVGQRDAMLIVAAVTLLIVFLGTVDDIARNLQTGAEAAIPVFSAIVRYVEVLLQLLIDHAPHVIADD